VALRIIEGGLSKTLDFPLDSAKAYSSYWRVNRSSRDATELAFLLKALRKVACHIGHNVRPITWRGMSIISQNSIVLNPNNSGCIYPVTFEDVDIMVGNVVREAFSDIEWSVWIKNRIFEKVTLPFYKVGEFLKAVVDCGEDIFINELIKSTVWEHYLSCYLKKTSCFKSIHSQGELSDYLVLPGPLSLSQVWRDKAIGRYVPDNIHINYYSVLDKLLYYAAELKELTKLDKVSERRVERLKLYLRLWYDIMPIIMEWETNMSYDGDSEGVESKGKALLVPDFEELNNDDCLEDDNDEGKGLPPELAKQVQSLLEDGEKDLTKQVSVVVEDPEARLMDTVFTNAVAECNLIPDKRQVKRLQKIFKAQESLIRRKQRKRVKRCLEQGKLDHRRLSRAYLDGKVFKQNNTFLTDFTWEIAIVSDASASMGSSGKLGNSWSVAQQTFLTLAEAAKGYKNRLDIYGYHEKEGKCELIRLYQKHKLYTVYPSGKTPSGQAILAAAIEMNSKKKKKMIIHITDGAANCGIKVDQGMKYCIEKNIDLFTIGCGCNKQTRDFLQQKYPIGTLYLMKDIYGLSIGLESLFRKKLLC